MTEAEALKILNIELKDLNDNEKINLKWINMSKCLIKITL